MISSKYTDMKRRPFGTATTHLSLLFLILSLFISLSCVAESEPSPQGFHSTGSQSITGHWVMPDGSALIEVFPSGESYSVRIVALRETRFTVADELSDGAAVGNIRLDLHNPNPKLRQRSVVGLTIASGLTFDGTGNWSGGTIYDPGSGRSYRCNLELAPGGFLRVRGYIGISLLGRTLYWQRASNFKQRVAEMMAAYRPQDTLSQTQISVR